MLLVAAASIDNDNSQARPRIQNVDTHIYILIDTREVLHKFVIGSGPEHIGMRFGIHNLICPG